MSSTNTVRAAAKRASTNSDSYELGGLALAIMDLCDLVDLQQEQIAVLRGSWDTHLNNIEVEERLGVKS